jgi:hypothetical protein
MGKCEKLDIYESYDVLELKPGATEAEIKAQYRKLLHEWHPDRNRASEQKEAEATEKTALLNNAYDVIKSHIIPYTIPRPEASTAHTSPNGQRQANAGATHGVRREPSGQASWQSSRDVSYARRPYVKKITVDGDIGTGMKVALGITLLLFIGTIFYGLTGGRGLSVADLLMNRDSDTESRATNNNSGAPNASPGTNNGNGSVYVNNDPNSSDPYASGAPALDSQGAYQGSAGQANTSDPYASQGGAYGSGNSGQSVNQYNPNAQGYSGAGTANEQNTVNQNNGQGAATNGGGANEGMSNYYGNYNNYNQGANGYGEGERGEGERGEGDDDD